MFAVKVIEVEVLAPCVRGWICSWDTGVGVACGVNGATVVSDTASGK